MKKKTNSKKTAIIGGAALLTVIAAYVVMKKRKQRAYNDGLKKLQDSPIPNNGQIINTMPIGNAKYPLKVGSKGENVRVLQAYLNKAYNAGLKEDGSFGSGTLSAVKKYLKGVDNVPESLYNLIAMDAKKFTVKKTVDNKKSVVDITKKALSDANPLNNLAKWWNMANEKKF
jgi:hypothetical protein